MRRFFGALVLILLAGAGFYYYSLSKSGLTGNNILVTGILSVTSTAFTNAGRIPDKYTCYGTNVNPTIDLDRVPFDARSLVLIVYDIDSPAKDFIHWLVYNIDPTISRIDEESIPQGGQVALNDFNKREYDGPCPPLGLHRYIFRVYALNTIIPVDTSMDKTELDKLIKGHIIAKGELRGDYIKY